MQLWEAGLEPLEDRDRAREIVVVLRVEPRDARVLSVRRPEATLGLALLVVGVDVLDVEDGKRAAALVSERDAVALGRLGNRQADRQGPREAAAEPHGLDDALVVLPAHEPSERGEGTGSEHVQIGQLARGERDDRERVEVVGTVARAWRERAAVGSDELVGGCRAHARTSEPIRPSSSSLWTTIRALSSGLCTSVSTTISGFSGASYGSSTPVKPLISPA